MGRKGGFPGGGMGNMGAMMKQAQKMQVELARAQEEIKDMTFEASAGGGMVKAVAQGDNSLVSLTIDGRSVTVPAGTSVMRAAASSGGSIPSLCATDSVKA